MMRACSIDVGKVNLGVYIEEFTQHTTKALYLRRVDLTEKLKERVTPQFLSRLFAYLDSISALLETCDNIIIEKQLRANPEAQFVDHALQSYFVIRNHKGITSFSSKNKTRLFDSSKMTKYQRKKWATNKALEMLEDRGETDLLEYVRTLKKKDDVADAICQLDAWKNLKFGEDYCWKSTRPVIPLTPTTPATEPKKTRKKKDAPPAEKPVEEKQKKTRKKKDAPEEKPVEEKPKKTRKKKDVTAEKPVEEKQKKTRKKKDAPEEKPVEEKPKKTRKEKDAPEEKPVEEKV